MSYEMKGGKKSKPTLKNTHCAASKTGDQTKKLIAKAVLDLAGF